MSVQMDIEVPLPDEIRDDFVVGEGQHRVIGPVVILDGASLIAEDNATVILE